MTKKRKRRPVDLRIPFYLGQPMDEAVRVIRRTGREGVGDPEILNAEEINDLTTRSLRVRWRLTDGVALVIDEGRGPAGDLPLAQRVVAMELWQEMEEAQGFHYLPLGTIFRVVSESDQWPTFRILDDESRRPSSGLLGAVLIKRTVQIAERLTTGDRWVIDARTKVVEIEGER